MIEKSLVPFTYWLQNILTMWLSYGLTHIPDGTLPYDDYKGYHAMALTICLGLGDKEIMNTLPAKVNASKALIVGLRSWDEDCRSCQAD